MKEGCRQGLLNPASGIDTERALGPAGNQAPALRLSSSFLASPAYADVGNSVVSRWYVCTASAFLPASAYVRPSCISTPSRGSSSFALVDRSFSVLMAGSYFFCRTCTSASPSRAIRPYNPLPPLSITSLYRCSASPSFPRDTSVAAAWYRAARPGRVDG